MFENGLGSTLCFLLICAINYIVGYFSGHYNGSHE